MVSDPVAQGAAVRGAAAPRRKTNRLSPLTTYAWSVAALGLAVLALVVLLSPVGVSLARHPVPLVALVIALVVSELTAVPVTRRDNTVSATTISTTFAVALIVVGPLWLVMVTQVFAGALDDLRGRRRLVQVAFNAGQYALSLLAARAVFSWASGHELLGGFQSFDGSTLVPALVAGLTFGLVNHLLVSIIAALATGQRIVPTVRHDVVFQLETSGVLVALGPIAAVLANVSVLMLPLLVLPVLAVRRTALLAATREHQSLHDPLTGLGNRTLFRGAVERAIARQHERGVAVLLLDLDHFKDVNDTLGHHVGDDLLCEVSARLSAAAAEPGLDATVARLGGDEFAVVLSSAEPLAAAQALAARVLHDLSRPVEVAQTRLAVQASIGITTSEAAPLEDVHSALKKADIAMYEAKGERARACVHVPGSDSRSVGRLMLLPQLREAIDAGQLVVDYQPQSDARTGDLVAVEALVRWNHPELGRLEPAAFIDLAESAGLIAPITTYVLESALGELARWRSGGWEGSIAVNLSARQLSDLNLPSHVGSLLELSGVPASCLTVEVTESSLMADPRAAQRILAELRAMGVQLSIDDFGTGYSSLVLLQRLRVDELKIDRSFVAELAPGSHDEVLVRSIVELGHNLSLRVVAEGVESAAAAAHLRRLGVDVLQGHLVGRPRGAAATGEAVLGVRRARGAALHETRAAADRRGGAPCSS